MPPERPAAARSATHQVVRDIFEQAWNRQEFDAIAPHLADSIQFNFRGDRFPTNLEDLRGLVAFWREAFPDLRFEVRAVVGEADVVAANLVFTGSQQGPWRELEPTGRSVEVEEMMFFRFEDGLLVELWEVFDEHEMRRQLAGDG